MLSNPYVAMGTNEIHYLMSWARKSLESRAKIFQPTCHGFGVEEADGSTLLLLRNG